MAWQELVEDAERREREAVLFIHDLVIQLWDQGLEWDTEAARSIIKKMVGRGWTVDIAMPNTNIIRRYLTEHGSDSDQWPGGGAMQLCDELEVARRKQHGWRSAITRKWNRSVKRRAEVDRVLEMAHERSMAGYMSPDGQEQGPDCRILTMDDKSSVKYPKHRKRKAKSGDPQQAES